MLMKELLKMKSLIILFMFLLMSCAAKKENQEEEILKAILNTKKEIENRESREANHQRETIIWF